MGVYSMLTNYGVDEINSAQSDVGILLEISHYVGVYDAQLASDYDNNLVAQYSNIANYTSPTDTVPSGDVYWRSIPVVLASPDREDVYADVSYQPVTYTDTNPENYQGTWEVSTDEFPTPALKGYWWNVVGSGTVDSITFEDGDTLTYNGVAYTNGSNANKRANFKVTITADIDSPTAPGELLINKVAVYGSRRSVDGALQAQDVYLIGQVIIPDAQLIQDGEGVDAFSTDQLILDFQIDTQAITVDFENVLYATANDYWQRLTNGGNHYGLSYDGQVMISNRLGVEDINGEFPSSDDVGVGKLLVSTFATVNRAPVDGEATIPQLVLQYVDSEEYGTENSSAFSPRIRTTFRTTPDGDCEVDMYGSCNNDFGYYSFVPEEDKTFGLGNNTNRWKHIQASDSSTVYLGCSYDTGKGDRWYYIDHETQNSSTGGHDTTKENGFMVLRNNDLSINPKLGMGYFGNSSVFVGPHYDNRDIHDSGSNPHLLWRENYFFSYGNISNYMAVALNNDADENVFVSYPLNVRSTADILLFHVAEGYKSAFEFGSKNGTVDSGYDSISNGVDIWNMAIGGQRDDSLSPEEFVQNFVKGVDTDHPSIFKQFFTPKIWSDMYSNGDNLKSIESVRESLYGVNGKIALTHILDSGTGINKDILLASSRIIATFGDMMPIVDGLNNFGGSSAGYKDLFINRIVNSRDTLLVDSNIYPDKEGLVIGRNPITKYRWEEVNTVQLGNNVSGEDDWIDAGFIKDITSNTINTKILISDEIDCVFINPVDARDNPDYNINIGRINGIDIARYLAQVQFSKYYMLPIDPLDSSATTGPDFWNFKRCGDAATYTITENGSWSFSYNISGELDFDDNMIPYISSLIVVVRSGEMMATSNGTDWELNNYDTGDENASVCIFNGDGDTFKETLIDVFGQDAYDNTDFPSNDKFSNRVSASFSTDNTITAFGKTEIKYSGASCNIGFAGTWRRKSSTSSGKYSWSVNRSVLKNGSTMSVTII